MNSLSTKLLALLLAVAGTVQAQNPATLAVGEVRKIDTAQNKLTIKHGEISSLSMPPMTMVFKVQDPGLLSKVKEGDKIRFSAAKLTEGDTVTRIEIQP